MQFFEKPELGAFNYLIERIHGGFCIFGFYSGFQWSSGDGGRGGPMEPSGDGDVGVGWGRVGMGDVGVGWSVGSCCPWTLIANQR